MWNHTQQRGSHQRVRQGPRRCLLLRGRMNHRLGCHRPSRCECIRRNRNCRCLLVGIANGVKPDSRVVIAKVARSTYVVRVGTRIAHVGQVHLGKVGRTARIRRIEWLSRSQRKPPCQRRAPFTGEARTVHERDHRRRVHRSHSRGTWNPAPPRA
jgi:hypothetical protein